MYDCAERRARFKTFQIVQYRRQAQFLILNFASVRILILKILPLFYAIMLIVACGLSISASANTDLPGPQKQAPSSSILVHDSPLQGLPAVQPDETPLSAIENIFVKRILLEGNTIFSDEQLRDITSAYENRTITAEELQGLKESLTGYYITNGYINSGVVIPDQEVQKGEIRLRIIEGKLSDVTISGNARLRRGYVVTRLAPRKGNLG